MKFDVIIIGGSYAGLSAALQLGRARRNVLVVDAGQRRNRFASHSHGFLGQDGKAPGDIIAEAKSQLGRYPTVQWTNGRVTDAEGSINDFRIEIDGRRQEGANRLILAMGVVDELPDIPGLQQRWGQSVFHCPYCHGYELNQGQIGVVAASTLARHHAMMLPDWGKTTLFTNGVFTPDAEQRATLLARGTDIEEIAIAEILGNADILLNDGRMIAMDGLFTQPKAIIAAQWITKLGCEVQEEQMGSVLITDAMKQTSVAGIFSCGDIARLGGSLAFAVGDGAMAGIAAHRTFLFPE